MFVVQLEKLLYEWHTKSLHTGTFPAYTPRMRGRGDDGVVRRTCVRVGCAELVKKPTGKYCSIKCCAIDPVRHERLRIQARRQSGRNVLPMTRQLTFTLFRGGVNPEAALAALSEGREDIPAGMSRFVG